MSKQPPDPFKGLPLKDATDTLLAPISFRAARIGDRTHTGECVVAVAAKEIHGVLHVKIGAGTARIIFVAEPGVVYRYQLDEPTRLAVKLFDATGDVSGFDDLGGVARLIPHRKPLGSRAGEKHGSNVRGTGQKRQVHHEPPLRDIRRAPEAGAA